VQVYLVQHGEAKPEAQDPTRPLTDRGREEVQRVAQHAAALGLRIAEIRHSGKLRARQTAEILVGALSPLHGIREMDGLAPADDPGKATAEIESAREPLMLVGHLPHLSRLASLLLVGDPGREIIRFRNGAIVCLVQGEGRWLLQWVLTPEFASVRS
jgi:phosphohistidine phosphatase